MSARDLLLPRTALRDFLDRSTRRVEAIERRAVWSPAVVSDGVDFTGSPFLVVGGIQDSTDPSYPQPGTAFAGVTLDPGRWIIMARIWGELAITGGAGGEMGMHVTPIDLYKSKRWGFASFTRQQTFEHAFEVVAESEYDATVGIYAGAEPGYSSGFLYLYSALIIAFPG
jgi:hypothetical protein